MDKNGTDLGNHNTKLLQKIEELKKQNAKFEQQQQELMVLKKEIEKLKPVSNNVRFLKQTNRNN